MLTYETWRPWLQAKATELKSDNLTTRFDASPGDSPKPGMALGLIGQRAMGNFECWITGEADYTILAPPSPDARMVCHKWGLIVTDETFEATFHEFISEFRLREFDELSGR